MHNNFLIGNIHSQIFYFALQTYPRSILETSNFSLGFHEYSEVLTPDWCWFGVLKWMRFFLYINCLKIVSPFSSASISFYRFVVLFLSFMFFFFFFLFGVLLWTLKLYKFVDWISCWSFSEKEKASDWYTLYQSECLFSRSLLFSNFRKQ